MREKVIIGGLTVLLLLQTGPVLSQETSQESQQIAQLFNSGDTKKLELLRLKFARLAVAYAYLDPALVLQEIDTMEPYIKAAEAPLARYPMLKTDPGQLRNIVALMKLYPLAEFGALDDFKLVAEPLIVKAPDPNHRISTLFLGMKGSFIQRDHAQSHYYLDRVREEIAKNPSAISPVHLYSLESFEVMQQLAEGKVLNTEQLGEAFQRAWSLVKNYDPNPDWRSSTNWANGRYASLFWIHQLSKHQTEDKIVTPAIEKALEKWGSNPSIRTTGEVDKDLEQAQGLILFVLTMVDTHLVAKEEYLESLLTNENSDFFQNVEELFSSLDEQTNQIQALFNIDGFPKYDLSKSAFVSELRFRFAVLKTLDRSIDLATRKKSLESLAIQADSLDLPESIILNHLRIGKVFLLHERPDQAITSWEKAFEKANETGYQNLASEASRLLTAEFARQEKWERAGYYATQVSESLQHEIASTDLDKIAEMAKRTADGEAQAYLNSSEPQKALIALDRGRQLNTAAITLSASPEALSAAQSLAKSEKKVAKLTQSVSKLKRVASSDTRNQLLADAEKILAESRAEFLVQGRKIRAKYPGLYTSTLRFDPLNLAEVQKSLETDVSVVQYFATESELYIFVVDRDQFRLRSVSAKSQEIDASVSSFLAKLQTHSKSESKHAKELYQVLISPIEADIKDAKQLVLIPSGKLNVLPFAALMNESGQRLTEQKGLAELAKTTDFMRIANSKAEAIKSVAAFTNATLDLPATDEEGRQIVEMFPGSVQYRGSEASKENLMEYGAGKDVLHLATHGISDGGDALLNHLKLANNVELGQEEIFGLDLSSTSMVTLSACSTALGDAEVEGYVASLAEAFWIAGSPTVIASLWPVEDESTGILMTEFYKGMKNGLGRAEALRLAQKKVMTTPGFAHPYFWSGFVAFGDYR